jgi:hypothetical protein
MAHAGTATIEVVADTTKAEEAIRALKVRSALSWPDVGLVAVVLSFAGFVIDKVV